MFKIIDGLYNNVVHTVICEGILLILYVMFKIIVGLYNKVTVICEGEPHILLILYVMFKIIGSLLIKTAIILNITYICNVSRL